jgi:hypothetical protein
MNPAGMAAHSPTIALVGCDPLQLETIRASLAGSPFHLIAASERPAVEKADLLVLPAADLPRNLSSSPPVCDGMPVIAHGPAGLMRAAFLCGCADYLRDPWTAQELALRAEAVLSRRRLSYEFPWGRTRFEGDTLCAPGGQVALTRQQAVILRALLRRRGVPVARAALACLLGAGPKESRRVDVQVSAIRRCVRRVAPEAGRFIICVRSQGYMVP